MVAYASGNKAGAFIYNVFHHRGVAILIYFTGLFFLVPVLQLIGVVLFSHAAFDRMMGYGLKYARGFEYTHLGRIGKRKDEEEKDDK